MGTLDKYSKLGREKRTERIQVKLTPTEYNLYMKYLKERGLKASEATRFLILEEIGLGMPDDVRAEIAVNKESATIETTPESAKGVQKEVKKAPGDKPQYAQWRVDGLMPCPLCRTWQKNIAAHLKAAHKTTKQKVFADPQSARIASEMAKEKANID